MKTKSLFLSLLFLSTILLSACASNPKESSATYFTITEASDLSQDSNELTLSRGYKDEAIGSVENGEVLCNKIKEHSISAASIKMADGRSVDLKTTITAPDQTEKEQMYCVPASSLIEYTEILGISMLIPDEMIESMENNSYVLTTDLDFNSVDIDSINQKWNNCYVSTSIHIFPAAVNHYESMVTVNNPYTYYKLNGDNGIIADVIEDKDKAYISVVSAHILYEYILDYESKSDIEQFVDSLR